jgi:hypothetical protein
MLPEDLMAQIRAELEALDVNVIEQAQPEPGKRDLTMTFRRGEKLTCLRFVGAVPEGVQKVLDLIESEIEAQTKARATERPTR